MLARGWDSGLVTRGAPRCQCHGRWASGASPAPTGPRDEGGQRGIASRPHFPGCRRGGDAAAQHLGAERLQEQQVPPRGTFAECLCGRGRMWPLPPGRHCSPAADLCVPVPSELCIPVPSDLCVPVPSDLCVPVPSDLCVPVPSDLCVSVSPNPSPGLAQPRCCRRTRGMRGGSGGGLGEVVGDGTVTAPAGSSGTRPLRSGRRNGPPCGCTCGTSTAWPR